MVAAPAPDAGVVEALDEAPPDELESKLERATVSAHGLSVEVAWWTLTGNTHVADALAFTSPRGTVRLVAHEDDESALPLVDQIHRAGDARWVVLGWSSFGSGMQTQHAWLVDGTREPRIVDKLEWTTDRSHGGLAVNVSHTVEIGIPIPPASTGDDDALHDEAGWSLVHGARAYDLDAVRRLPALAVDRTALGHHYTPPVQRPPTDAQWSGRFVWFAAERRFVLQKL